MINEQRREGRVTFIFGFQPRYHTLPDPSGSAAENEGNCCGHAQRRFFRVGKKPIQKHCEISPSMTVGFQKLGVSLEKLGLTGPLGKLSIER